MQSVKVAYVTPSVFADPDVHTKVLVNRVGAVTVCDCPLQLSGITHIIIPSLQKEVLLPSGCRLAVKF